MKRYLTAIAAAILLCSLLACGGSGAPAATSTSTPAEAAVSADYAADKLLAEKGAYDEYSDGSSDYQVKVAFTANTDISEFKYLELSFVDPKQSDEIQFKEEAVLYETDVLKRDRPLVVSMHFDGDLPNRGIAYLDETGTERFYTVSTSGKDGSLLLTEFSPAS